jgi:hypothetical protein
MESSYFKALAFLTIFKAQTYAKKKSQSSSALNEA